MINKKYLKNLRSKEINNKNDFIFDLYNKRVIDSLDVISLEFKNILILGDQGTELYKYIYIERSYSSENSRNKFAKIWTLFQVIFFFHFKTLNLYSPYIH